jgi:Domain of unknown function (DUF892)
MKANSLRELFVEQLKDLYDAEHQLIKALPKIAGLPPLFWSTTPSADFCGTVRMNHFILSHVL